MPNVKKTYPSPKKAPDIFYDTKLCPIRTILGGLGRKWPSLILCHLSFGKHRFSELKGAIPDISQRMLSQTLKQLERDGLISRDEQPGMPPRVEYELTQIGDSYIEPLQAMMSWGARHKDRIETLRKSHDEITEIQKTRNIA